LQARAYYDAHRDDDNPFTVAHGIGVMLYAGSGYVGGDIDDCLIEARLTQTAADILSLIGPTYAEMSVSGTGIRYFVRGKLAPEYGRKNDDLRCEIYEEVRFLVLTGPAIDDSPVAHVTEGLLEVQRGFFARRSPPIGTPIPSLSGGEAPQRTTATSENGNTTSPGVCGKETIRRFILNDRKAGPLWQGDTRGLNASGADARLTAKLLYYSGGDKILTKEMLRESGLYRDKYDEPRPLPSGAMLTYVDLTISNVYNWMVENNMFAPGRSSRAPKRGGRPIADVTILAARVILHNPTIRPKDLAKELGIRREHAKTIAHRLRQDKDRLQEIAAMEVKAIGRHVPENVHPGASSQHSRMFGRSC
jgi:hypothetical protein